MNRKKYILSKDLENIMQSIEIVYINNQKKPMNTTSSLTDMYQASEYGNLVSVIDTGTFAYGNLCTHTSVLETRISDELHAVGYDKKTDLSQKSIISEWLSEFGLY